MAAEEGRSCSGRAATVACWFERLITEHRQKLANYKANPLAHDNKGVLRNAPTEEIRQKIINGRVQELERQIMKQESELRKVLDRLEEGTK